MTFSVLGRIFLVGRGERDDTRDDLSDGYCYLYDEAQLCVVF